MARISAKDWNKKQKKYEEKLLERDVKAAVAESNEKKARGHIAGDMERADTNRTLFRISQTANDIRSSSSKNSAAYKNATRLLKRAVNSENSYRRSMAENMARREATRPANGNLNSINPMSRDSYYNRLTNLGANRQTYQYEQAKKAREDYLAKYGDVDNMSSDELKKRIKNLEDRKSRNQAIRSMDGTSAQSTNTGTNPTLPSGLTNEQKRPLQQANRLTSGQRQRLDADDARADDFLEVYQNALPGAILRDEEKKLTAEDKEILNQAAELYRRENKYGAGMRFEQNKEHSTIDPKVEKIKSKGVDTDWLIDTYATRKDNAEQEANNRAYRDFANEGILQGALASAATVLASPMTAVEGAAAGIGHYIKSQSSDKPVAMNQSERWLSNATDETRSAVNENIKNINNPFLKFGADLAYNGLMAAGDSAMSLALGGAAGAGLSAKAATRITQGLMSVGAAQATYNDAVERGLDANHALGTALMAGVAEWATEKYSIDGLKHMVSVRPEKLRNVVTNIGKQMLTEGSEEAASDVLNFMGDNIINGKKSEYNQNVKAYMQAGLSRDAAKRAAMMDFLGQTAYDAAVGAFSGALMGGGAEVTAYKTVKEDISGAGQNIKKAGELNALMNYGKALDIKEAKGKVSEDIEVGRLADAVEKSINEKVKSAQNAEELQTIYEELSEDAPDSVGIQIDHAVREKAEELSTSENDTEALNAIYEASTDSYIERSSRFESKIGTEEETTENEETENDNEVEEITPQITGNKNAVFKASGEPVTIDGFVQTGVKDVEVKIDGETDTVPLSELTFESPFVERMYHTAAELDDAAAASAMISNYDGKQNAARYFEDFEKAYNFGSVGLDYNTMTKRSPFIIPENVVRLAYDLGVNAWVRESEKPQTPVTKKGTGKAIDTREDLIRDDGYSEIDKALAKRLGIDIKEVEVATDSEGNANSNINGYLDLSKGEMVFSDVCESKLGVRIHETMEFIEAVTPQDYRRMVMTLMYYMTDESNLSSVYDTVMKYRDAYREEEGSKTFAEAMDEFMNDAISGVFMSEEGAKDFINWLNKDEVLESKDKQNVLQTIANVIQSIINKIKDTLGHLTKAQQTTANMEIETQEHIKQMFLDAMDKAGEVYKSGETVKSDTKIAASRGNSLKVLSDGTEYVKLDGDLFDDGKGGKLSPREAYNKLIGSSVVVSDGDKISFVKRLPGKKKMYDELFKRRPNYDGISDIEAVNETINKNIVTIFKNSTALKKAVPDINDRHKINGIVKFDTREVKIADDKDAYRLELSIAELSDGRKVAYAKKYIEIDTDLKEKIEAATVGQSPQKLPPNDIITQSEENATPNKKFSVKVPIEETKNLIAIHNITEDKLLQTLEVGGFAMPSIAITKDSINHEKFGDISVVFRKDTIDPSNPDNRVYSADAYTARFPQIDYEASKDDLDRLAKKLDISASMIEANVFDGAQTPEQIIERMERLQQVKEAFISDNNIDVTPAKRIPDPTILENNDIGAKVAVYFIEKGISVRDLIKNKQYQNDIITIVRGDQSEATFGSKRRAARAGMLEKRMQKASESEEDFDNFERKFKKDLDIINGVAEPEDYESGYRDGINGAVKKHEKEYDSYVRGLLNEVSIKRGIRNQKDPFTSSGASRSFDQLHYEYNLNNLVKAMKELGDAGAEGGAGFGLFSGLATERLGSIEEIKRERDRIKKMSDEEIENLKAGLSERLYAIGSELAKGDESYFAIDNEIDAITEALKKAKTKNGFIRALKEYSPNAQNITSGIVSDIFELMKDVRSMPTMYLEAKPARAVGFDEVAGVAIPSDASYEVIEGLKNNNIPYVTYNKYLDKSRIDAVNSFDGIKFSMKVSPFHMSVKNTTDTVDLIKENEHLKEAVRTLEEEFKNTDGTMPDKKKIKTAAGRILKQYSSTYDKDTLIQNITAVYRYLMSEGADYEEALKTMSDIAKGVLEKTEIKDTSRADEYKSLKKQLRSEGITLSEAQRDEIKYTYGSMSAYRKACGYIKINTNGATTLDQQWQEWSEAYPELFSPETKEGDMPIVLEGIISSLAPQVETLNGETIDQTSYDVALQIYHELAKVPVRETFADKKDRETYETVVRVANSYEKLLEAYRKDTIEQNKVETAEELEKIADEKRRRIGKLMSEVNDFREAKKSARNPKTLEQYKKEIEKREKQIKRLKEANDMKLAEQRQRFTVQRLRRAEQSRMTETKDKIRKLHQKFRTMINKPTETMYVPAELMRSAIEVCETVNLGAKPGSQLYKALDDARRAFEDIKKDTENYGVDDFNPQIQDDLDRLALIMRDKGDDFNIYDMTAAELQEVYDCMNEVYESIRRSVKLIREEGEKDVRRAGRRVIKELNESKGVKDKWISKKADKLTSSFLNSYREFRRLSGYKEDAELMDIWKDLNAGQRKMYDIQMEGEQLLQTVTAREDMQKTLELLDDKKGLVKVPLRYESGNADVYITRGMRLALILHGRSQANFNHMAHGGVMVPVAMDKYKKDKKEAYEHTRKVKGITKAALMQMESELTKEEKDLLKIMEKFFHDWTGDYVNQTSMDLYGFKKARVHEYYPISVDKDFVAADIAALKFDKTIEGAGFLKERISSVKPIVLESVIDTAMRSLNAVSMFSGLAIPIRNFNKIMNVTTYKAADPDSEGTGNVRFVPDTSVRKTLKEVWGERAEKYLNDLIADLQQARNRETTWYDKLRSNYAGAVLTANMSVIIKQTSAYPTCASVTGWVPTIKAMFRGGKNNWLLSKADVELINQYTPLHWYRNKGNGTRELAEIRDTDSFVNRFKPVRFAIDAIQKVDMAMVGRFWYAAQYSVNESHPELKKAFDKDPDNQKAKDAYYNEVAKIFDRCVEETQSTNMTLQNADIMRNPADGMKIITMFMGQGLQNFGIVYDSFNNMRAKKEQLKNGEIEKDVYKQAKKDFANAVTSQMVSAAVFAGLAIVARALLHRMNPYRDDKEEITAESIIERWSDDFLENMAGSVPLGSFIYEGVTASIDAAQGKGWSRVYGQSDIVLGAISDLESSTTNLVRAITKGEGILDALNEVAKDGSKLCGVPYENVWNLCEGTVKHIKDTTNGEGMLSFSSDKKNPSTTVLAGYLDKAIQEGDSVAQEKYIELLYDLGKSSKEINSLLAKKLKERDDVKEAAAAKKKGNMEAYEKGLKKLEDIGYPEQAIISAIKGLNRASAGSAEPVKPSDKSIESLKEDVKIYESKDLIKAVEDGDQSSINLVSSRIYKDKYEATSGTAEEKAKAGTAAVKNAVNSYFRKLYMSSTTAHERQDIKKKLSMIAVAGKKVYDQSAFQRWEKDYQKK